MRLLLVEDDRMIGEGLQKALRKEGFAVNWAQDGSTANIALNDDAYDLVILDLGLPDQSGLEVLAKLRKSGNSVPVIILTAKDAISDKVRGLDAGADDYLLKPFVLEELEARIRSLMRRQAGNLVPEEGWLSHEKLSLNPKTHEVLFNGKSAMLSGREFSLIYALIKTPSAVLSKRQIEESIYGWNEEVASNAVEVHVHQIRKKLGTNIIKNIRNVGYTLTEAK
ncbi:MAG: DNA-binding response regulator [Micavibrio aeruginosavorus]|uniref:DNA-binding response regulator n=1 Tax=Micavibrio aeruginosavorus TaxID=349221 RepID=A0A2W5FRP7_9BACT|nr:MAG: DNA-binding response regulator [Micavibrio aeruginosavorus]